MINMFHFFILFFAEVRDDGLFPRLRGVGGVVGGVDGGVGGRFLLIVGGDETLLVLTSLLALLDRGDKRAAHATNTAAKAACCPTPNLSVK